jgi:hypothetical protein
MSGPPEVGMGLFGKLIGSRPGQPGITPVPADDLRAALLVLGDGELWQVRDGADHDCDLVAEWQIAVERHGASSEQGRKTAFLIKMKFDPAAHEVRHDNQQSSASWRTGASSANRSPSAGLGYSFNSSDMTDPLRDTVTSHGWGWKTAFKL